MQFWAFPRASTPSGKLPAEHCAGALASDVEVAALPVVLLVMFAGKSVVARERKPIPPVVPLGVPRNWFAAWPAVAVREIAGVVVGLVTLAVNHGGVMGNETSVTLPEFGLAAGLTSR